MSLAALHYMNVFKQTKLNEQQGERTSFPNHYLVFLENCKGRNGPISILPNMVAFKSSICIKSSCVFTQFRFHGIWIKYHFSTLLFNTLPYSSALFCFPMANLMNFSLVKVFFVTSEEMSYYSWKKIRDLIRGHKGSRHY